MINTMEMTKLNRFELNQVIGGDFLGRIGDAFVDVTIAAMVGFARMEYETWEQYQSELIAQGYCKETINTFKRMWMAYDQATGA